MNKTGTSSKFGSHKGQEEDPYANQDAISERSLERRA